MPDFKMELQILGHQNAELEDDPFYRSFMTTAGSNRTKTYRQPNSTFSNYQNPVSTAYSPNYAVRRSLFMKPTNMGTLPGLLGKQSSKNAKYR